MADDTGLTRVAPPSASPVREIWMGVHRDTRDNPRIRAMQEAIVGAVDDARPRLAPAD